VCAGLVWFCVVFGWCLSSIFGGVVMGRLRVFFVVLVVSCGLVGVVSACAFAEATAPSVLPEGTTTEPVNGKSECLGKSTFGNGVLKFEAGKCESTFSSNAKKLGTFDLLYLEMTLEGVTCTGLTDKVSGSLLMTGTFHVRHYNLNSKLFTAETWLLNELHFECGTVLVRWKGCLAAELTPNEEKLTEKLTLTFKTEKGDNVPVKVLNEEDTGEENCELLSSLGTGAFKLSAVTQVTDLKGFEKNKKAVTVLVMPL
jgi:hypothetical protein